MFLNFRSSSSCKTHPRYEADGHLYPGVFGPLLQQLLAEECQDAFRLCCIPLLHKFDPCMSIIIYMHQCLVSPGTDLSTD